ncbi:MAG: hypothetical protein Q8O94_03680 [bacterium]|nr:hypothetical protein [bacterium]
MKYQINILRNNFMNTKIVVAVIVSLVAGIFIGGILFFSPNSSKLLQESSVDVNLLANPVLYEWWASAQGIIVEKGEDYIVLDKNGQLLRVDVLSHPLQSTAFARAIGNQSPPEEFEHLSFEDIVTGMRLRGTVSVTAWKGEERVSEQASRVVGHDFTVLSEE